MQISIKMLGELQVFHENQLIPLPASKLTRALMVYLLLNPKPQQRQHLCRLFWPDTKDARGALRWSLSKLRLVLHDHTERVVADKDHVSINTSGMDIDVVNLLDHTRHQQMNPAKLADFAVQLQSPLLEGIDLQNNLDFQCWLIAQRQDLIKFRNKMINQYAALASQHAQGEQKSEADSVWPQQALQQHQQDIHFCTTKDDVSIAYASVGQGFPIVKTASWMSHLQYDWQGPVWGSIFHRLAERHQFIRYDDRGMGLSERNVEELSFHHMVQDLDTVISANQLTKFALLGISNGAATAIEYVVRYPERVSHLILCSGFAVGWLIEGTAEQRARIEAIIALAECSWEQSNPAIRQLISMMFLPEANQQELNWYNNYMRLATSAHNAARFIAAIGELDVRQQLAKVTVPTLVIHSQRDDAIPAITGRDIAASISNAEFVGLDSCSHFLLERERAAQHFIDVIQEFMSRK